MYQRPAVTDFDPNRVNSLWKQIKWLLGDVDPSEVAELLNARGMRISKNRVAAWTRSESSDKFSPMNIAELQSVIDALFQQEQSRL